MRLKSLYVGTFAALTGILLLSFLAFHAISNRVQTTEIDPTFERADELQLESCRGILASGGVKALAGYLAYLDRLFGGNHFLLDARGIDQVTGEDRSSLLPPPPATQSRRPDHKYWIIAHRSQDGLYWFAAYGLLPRPQIWAFLPYYFLVIGATGLLCWVAAVGVVSPLRRIAGTIAVFGQGDLTARIQTDRPDEIGQLGRSFNQMAERLERLIISERRLLSDISHELRSPLARLKFAIRLARSSPDTGAALDRIERDVDRITSLVSDIVDITILEGDPALQGTEPTSLLEVVDEVVRDTALEAQFRSCTIEVERLSDARVLGSRELLRRAVENVVRNGIRYSPEESTIRIVVSEKGREAIVSIRDRGPGVPEDTLMRLFDPFFRVEEARDGKNGGGSGVGLSIARRAVLLHHGTITAQNASPGLCVEIRIPLAVEVVPVLTAGIS